MSTIRDKERSIAHYTVIFLTIVSFLLPSAPAESSDLTPKNDSYESITLIDQSLGPLEIADKMIERMVAKLHEKRLHKTTPKILIVQGETRTYDKKYYRILFDMIGAKIVNRKLFQVHIMPNSSVISVKSTPTHFKVTRPYQHEIEEMALEKGVNGILFWDLYQHENKTYLSAYLSTLEDHQILWKYQTDEAQIQREEKEREELVLIQPKDYSTLSLGLDYVYLTNGFERTATSGNVNDNQSTKWMPGFHISGESQSILANRIFSSLSFGFHQTIEKPSVGLFQMTMNMKIQLNKYVPPLFDKYTGEMVAIRNRKKFLLGVSLGPALFLTSGSSYKQTIIIKPHLSIGLSKNLGITFGTMHFLDQEIKYESSAAFVEQECEDPGTFIFMNLAYSFNFTRDSEFISYKADAIEEEQ
ncbi:MAG: hypothetical protein ACMUIP_06155 [bacterium]